MLLLLAKLGFCPGADPVPHALGPLQLLGPCAHAALCSAVPEVLRLAIREARVLSRERHSDSEQPGAEDSGVLLQRWPPEVSKDAGEGGGAFGWAP